MKYASEPVSASLSAGGWGTNPPGGRGGQRSAQEAMRPGPMRVPNDGTGGTAPQHVAPVISGPRLLTLSLPSLSIYPSVFRQYAESQCGPSSSFS